MKLRLTLLFAAGFVLAGPLFAQGTDRFALGATTATLPLDQGTIQGSTSTATAQLGEIGISPFATGKSHWFRINTDRPYRFNADTIGSQFDTTLAVYRGANLSELALVGGNDDISATNFSSSVEVILGHGTYYLAIDGSRNNVNSGGYVLNYSFTPTGIPIALPPPNDLFANAAALSVGDNVFLNSPAATTEASEPGAASRTAWYRFAATSSQRYTIRTVNAGFDSIVDVFTGSALNALTLVGSVDDIDFVNGNLDAEVSFDAVSGTTYWIRIGAASNTRGSTMVTLVPATVRGLIGIDAGFGGTWWNPRRAGEGVMIEVVRNPDPSFVDRSLLFFAWFTYDPAGNPTYLSGVATLNSSSVNQDIDMPVSITRGARFGSAFQAQDVQFISWGNVRLRYANCGQLTVSYTPTLSGWGGPGSVDMSRTFNRGVGLSCP